MDKVRLLEHILHQQFGSAVGEIGSLLLHRGSLSFAQLTRLSTLPPSTIHQSLLILSLHSLLYHSESEVSGKLLELYEMNPLAIERRMRGGWYVEMAREWDETEVLGEVVESLWLNGMQRKEGLVKVAMEEMKKRQEIEERNETAMMEAGVNSNGKGKGRATVKSESANRLAANKMLRRAFDAGFICIVTPGSQLSPSSLEIKWEEELRLSIKGIPSAKDMKELKVRLRAKKEEWDQEEVQRARGQTANNGRSSKKHRSSHDLDDDSDEDLDSASFDELPAAFFRVSTERFHMRWRAAMMVEYASQVYNEQVSRVFKLILDIVDPETDTMLNRSSRAINRVELQRHWDDIPYRLRPNLPDAFGADVPGEEEWNLSTKKDSDFLLEICYVLAGADNQGFHGNSFLFQSGEGQGSKWRIPYDALGARMKRALVEAMIKDRLGPVAIRCWRILEAKGKLDEKHLARLAFLTVKDARESIAILSDADLIEPQEVPRTADRAPSRTYFLWHVDYTRVVTSLLGHLYKSLANLQAQKQYQLGLKSALVEKRERTDVRADSSLLSKRDREQIKELDTKMEALTVAEMRIDQQLFVLKELDPDDAVE